jgi:hypothetical protein
MIHGYLALANLELCAGELLQVHALEVLKDKQGKLIGLYTKDHGSQMNEQIHRSGKSKQLIHP